MNRITQFEKSRREFLIKALGYSSLGYGIALLTGCAETSISPEMKRSIYKLGGQVKVNGIEANLDTNIIPGDSIITGDKSYIIFVVAGESFILRSNSTLKLGEFESPNPSIASAYLVRGKLLSVFAPRKPMQITTPQAIISIRGTGVYLESDQTQSYICTCYGETEIRSRKQPKIREIIKATHHDAPKYINNINQSAMIEPAPFKNHDDEELLLIETLVGRETPYLVPGGVTRSRKIYY